MQELGCNKRNDRERTRERGEICLSLPSKYNGHTNYRSILNDLIEPCLSPLTFHIRKKLFSNLNSTSS